MNILKSIVKNILIPCAYFFRYGTSLRAKVNIRLDVRKSKKSKIKGLHQMYRVSIGDYTYISPNAYIQNAAIGKYCSIGPNFLCGYGVHPVKCVSTSPMFYSTDMQNGKTLSKENKIEETKRISIGNDVFIGANVTVLDGVTIGDGAVIGAGAVVSKDIPPYAVALGVPIKVIKYRFEQPIIDKLMETKWWESDKNQQLVEKYFFDVEGFLNKLQ